MSNLCLLALCSFLLLRGFKNFFFCQKKLVLFYFQVIAEKEIFRNLKNQSWMDVEVLLVPTGDLAEPFQLSTCLVLSKV